MSAQYGWMKWGGGQAHGPFDSYELALEDAQSYLDDDEQADITINQILECSGEDVIHYFPSCDDMVTSASEQFDDTHGGSCDPMFELTGNIHDAQQALQTALKAWAQKWVCTNYSWWLDEGEKITIDANGVSTPMLG